MDLSIWVEGTQVSLPGVLALGAFIGYLAGLFGVGGGFLLTPLLVVVFRVPLPIAVGTGLCQMIGTATVALLRHQRYGQGEPRVGVLMLAGSLVGVHAGTLALAALAHLGEVTIRGRAVPLMDLIVQGGYVLLLLLAAATYARKRLPLAELMDRAQPGPLARVRLGPAVALPSVPPLRVSAIITAELGLLLGFLSGLLGLGGGIVLLPILTSGFGFPLRQAAGTGLVVLLATSVLGTVLHGLRGNVDLGLAMTLLAASSVSAQLGAMTTRRARPRHLRRGFALVIVGAVVAVAWNVVRQLVP